MSPEERAVVVAEIELDDAHWKLRKACRACPTIEVEGVRQRLRVISARAMVLRWTRDMCDPVTLIDEIARATAGES